MAHMLTRVENHARSLQIPSTEEECLIGISKLGMSLFKSPDNVRVPTRLWARPSCIPSHVSALAGGVAARATRNSWRATASATSCGRGRSTARWCRCASSRRATARTRCVSLKDRRPVPAFAECSFLRTPARNRCTDGVGLDAAVLRHHRAAQLLRQDAPHAEAHCRRLLDGRSVLNVGPHTASLAGLVRIVLKKELPFHRFCVAPFLFSRAPAMASALCDCRAVGHCFAVVGFFLCASGWARRRGRPPVHTKQEHHIHDNVTALGPRVLFMSGLLPAAVASSRRTASGRVSHRGSCFGSVTRSRSKSSMYCSFRYRALLPAYARYCQTARHARTTSAGRGGRRAGRGRRLDTVPRR